MLTMTVLSGPDLGRGGHHRGGHRGGGGRYYVRGGRGYDYYPDYYQEPLCQVVVKNAAGQAVSQLVPCRLLSGR